MTRAVPVRVANPPAKPLMLFDGDCHFCRRWVQRWNELTGKRVDYAAYQETLEKFPELTREECARAVQLIETDGAVYRAAEAVFRSLKYAHGRGWLLSCYQKVPGFAALTETGYAVVAANRKAASAVTRLLWGADVTRPSYFAARRGFLRTLGLVYLIAFISVWAQVDGLMGERGLLPAGEMLSMLRGAHSAGTAPFMQFPTLCWWNASSTMLHALCFAGVIGGALLAWGLVPVPALLVCFGCYLSLTTPGVFFFGYQWDILLLETGFVALFLAPWQWKLRPGGDAPVSNIGIFLAKALLFKLMFMSGVVKLTSGDRSWLDLTALDFHYWTQPLPTVFAWFADQSPEWLKKGLVAAALTIEVVAPMFIWAPRRPRLVAAWLLIGLQGAIALTGNYCFFNLLTIALCLLLFDDRSWAPARSREVAGPSRSWTAFAPAAALIVTLPVNIWLIYSAIRPQADPLALIEAISRRLEPFRIVNGYGLFRVMTKDRPEIVFEGSSDGRDWKPYEFRWKPGAVNRAPQWNAPHQPRLDWSLWFAALGSQRDRVVAERLAERLLQNEPTVLALLGENPFPGIPPQLIRADLYDYRFTNRRERNETGAWWKREFRGAFLRPLSKMDFVR